MLIIREWQINSEHFGTRNIQPIKKSAAIWGRFGILNLVFLELLGLNFVFLWCKIDYRVITKIILTLNLKTLELGLKYENRTITSSNPVRKGME